MARLVVCIAVGAILSTVAFAGSGPKPPSIPLPKSDHRQAPQIRMSQDWSTAEVVRVQEAVPSTPASPEVVVSYVVAHPELFHLTDPGRELLVANDRTDALGRRHIRFRQVYQGLRVWGCETIAHFRSDNTLYLIAGQTVPSPVAPASPSIAEAQAVFNARAWLSDMMPVAPSEDSAELLIYPDGGQTYLCWLVTCESRRPAYRYLIFVDARTGEIRHAINDQWTDGPATGTGTDVFGNTRTVQTYLYGGQYMLVNTTLPGYTPPFDIMRGVYVTDYGSGEWDKIATDADNVWIGNDSMKQAVSAHANIMLADDYFRTTHGRQGWDGNNSTIWIQTCIDTLESTCWWPSGAIDLNPGNGVTSLGSAGATDIVAHEFAHGVTQATAGLIYQFQSGALNESYSDFFGCMVDRDDWLLSEDVSLASPPRYTRNIANPHEGPDPDRYPFGFQPAHMSEYQVIEIGYDNGGVHINSGIPNRAGYLTAAVIGREKAETIWYRTLTTYLTPSANFHVWADLTVQSAVDLYGDGSPEEAAVHAAMDSVGLSSLYTPNENMVVSTMLGTHKDTFVVVRNLSTAPGTLLTATVSASVMSVLSGLPMSVPAEDSALVWIRFDAGMVGPCDEVQFFDTLFLTTDQPISPNIKIPIMATGGYGDIDTSWLDVGQCASQLQAGLSPSSAFVWFGYNYPYYNAVYDGSLLLGLIDGNDTLVYRDLYHTQNIPATNNFGWITTEYDETWPMIQAPFSTGDGRIRGRITYIGGNGFSLCGVLPVEYELYNVCDTPLTFVAGIFLDLDINNQVTNTAGVDQTNKIAWVRDDGWGHAVGLAAAGDTPSRLVTIRNRYTVWPTGSLEGGEAYAMMVNGTDTTGVSKDDYSILLTLGTATIGPGDTVRYRTRLLYSNTGVSGLAPMAANSARLIAPDTVRYFAISGRAPTDTLLPIGYLGWPRTTWQAAAHSSWLQFAASSGLTDVDPLHLQFATSALLVGRYVDTVTLTAAGAVAPAKIVIDLRVNPGTGKLEYPAPGFSSLSQVMELAKDGDTVLVGPGTYPGRLRLTNQAVRLISRDGPATTFLTGGVFADKTSVPGLEIAGFTFRNGHISLENSPSVIVRDNIFRAANAQPSMAIDLRGVSGLVTGNIVTSDDTSRYVNGLYLQDANDSLRIESNTITRTRIGMSVGGAVARVIVRQNLITRCITGIGFSSGVEVMCNNAWGNSSHDYGVPPEVTLDPSNISLDPLICTASDLTLSPASPCAAENNDCHVLIGARPVVEACVYCCVGSPGNIDCDTLNTVDIADLTVLIDNLFISFNTLCCQQEANVDRIGAVDIGDLTKLIDYLFVTFSPLGQCP